MMVSCRFLSLLIPWRIFWYGNCEVYDHGLSFNETVVRAACSLDCSAEPCFTNCTRTKQIKELDEKAKADVRLVCRDESYLVLAHNPGLFVIERRWKDIDSENLESWSDAVVSNAVHATMSPINHFGESYQFRLRRVSTSGISIPEMTAMIDRIPDVPGDIRRPIYLYVSVLAMLIGILANGYYKFRKRGLNKGIPVDEFEMNPDRLTITRVLGTGAFGVVKFGILRDDQGNVTTVAVKMLQDDSNENDRRNFLHEIKIMKAMHEHPNVICLLGCSTGPYPFLVVEYCSRGDLQSFLRKSLEEASTLVENEVVKRIVPTFRTPKRKEILQANSGTLSVFRNRDNYVEAASCTVDEQDINSDSGVVTVMDMLNFGRQIATGMEFLSSSRVVHRDLAARNILVCCDRTVKISDFGLSRDIYKRNVYKKSGNGREPLKWMAIEALTHQVYTTCSDVWSFGILLWEIMTLGGDPYPGVPTIEILNWLLSGNRMARPANCTIPLFKVMLSCWRTRPKDRPTFTILRGELEKLICAATKREYFDVNDVSEVTPPEDEDSQISGSHRTSDPPQVAIVNDLDPPIINVVQVGTMDEPEMS